MKKKDFISNIYNGKDDNTYFLFNVLNIIEPTIINYEFAKSDASKYWKNEEIKHLSHEKIQRIINSTDEISILEKISNDFNININKEILSNSNNILPDEFVKKIFNNKINDPINYYYNKNIYLAIIKSFIIDDLNNNLDNERININNNISDELKNVIIEKISNEIDIKINQDLINSLTSNI